MNLAELFKEYMDCEDNSTEKKIKWEQYVRARDLKRYVPTEWVDEKEKRSEPTGSFWDKK